MSGDPFSAFPRPRSGTEVTSVPDDDQPPEYRPPYENRFTWIVQQRYGRVTRVDADTCDITNGVLVFQINGLISAAFEYGDWKRIALLDRTTHAPRGYHILQKGRTP